MSFDGMAITTDVKLSRRSGQSWGLRLSGGVNFAFPLTAVKVRRPVYSPFVIIS